MSHDQIGRTTRRGFLGTATAATALTLGTFHWVPKRKRHQSSPMKSEWHN